MSGGFRWVSLFVCFLSGAAIILLLSCDTRDAGTPEKFVFARGSDARKLDPADVDDGESVNVLAQVCEGLVRFRSGTLEIEPALAREYSISDDGRTYTFELREGVVFHDGSELTAEAARFSFLRQMDPDHPAHLPDASFQYWNYLYQEVEAVEATGPMTLEFRLSEPNASFLQSLAIFPAFLIGPDSFETHGEEMARHPVGTGPYRFVRWSSNEAIVLERNPEYWGEAPEFGNLIFRVVPDNTARLLELRGGRVHALDGLQPAEIGPLEADERFTVYREPGLNVGYLVFSGFAERLENPEARLAIAMAIDRERLARVALDGAGVAAEYPLPPGMLGVPEDGEPVPFDPDRARELLADLPELTGRPLRLHVMTAPRPYFPDSVRAASLIRSDLQRIGLEVDVVARDFGSHLDALANGDFEMGLIGWIGDNGDPDNFLSVFFGSWAAERGAATNFSFYRNEEMDRLLLAARRETELVRRQEIYEEALALWRRDLPLVPLVHSEQIVVMRSEVEGFEMQKIGDLRLGPIRWREP